ncbi:uncharacterized protein LOC106869374 [Octopus bimaculoides]|uniref:uncharacterized protein LOC106869374 n=1 Tax=Octopus bimaculoides TaxID=37653 RepID=UPI00071DE9AF|nr:uncharacterized protein LOC106869374 [Octopus bimaculoides]|eukprot:XP_014770583.1 PREDICTED: pheromone-processing carboxypeptidase KEX1-like [Octopus bimaculoides]
MQEGGHISKPGFASLLLGSDDILKIFIESRGPPVTRRHNETLRLLHLSTDLNSLHSDSTSLVCSYDDDDDDDRGGAGDGSADGSSVDDNDDGDDDYVDDEGVEDKANDNDADDEDVDNVEDGGGDRDDDDDVKENDDDGYGSEEEIHTDCFEVHSLSLERFSYYFSLVERPHGSPLVLLIFCQNPASHQLLSTSKNFRNFENIEKT